eukprot:scaffold62600_cov60-Phaeocystis_antarctica.AAC.5
MHTVIARARALLLLAGPCHRMSFDPWSSTKTPDARTEEAARATTEVRQTSWPPSMLSSEEPPDSGSLLQAGRYSRTLLNTWQNCPLSWPCTSRWSTQPPPSISSSSTATTEATPCSTVLVAAPSHRKISDTSE